MPEEDRPNEIVAIAGTTTAQWSGPLPPPAVLREFDNIVANGAERIFRMAEQEQLHRIEMENRGNAPPSRKAAAVDIWAREFQ